MVDNSPKEKTAVGLARVAARSTKMRKGNQRKSGGEAKSQFSSSSHAANPITVGKEDAEELRKITRLREQGKLETTGPLTPEQSREILDETTAPLASALLAMGRRPH